MTESQGRNGDGSGLDVLTSGLTRRRVLQGAAWSVPIIMVGAPAAHAGISECTVNDTVFLADNVAGLGVRAICREYAQQPFVSLATAPAGPTVDLNYGTVTAPPYLQICNCQQDPAWFRWRETDTLSLFQIEVDGEHNDQDSSTGGYRTPFFLDSFGGEGGCQTFCLTYRTAVQRTGSFDFSITWDLEIGPSQTGPWSNVGTFTRACTYQAGGNIDLNCCPGTTLCRGTISSNPYPPCPQEPVPSPGG